MIVSLLVHIFSSYSFSLLLLLLLFYTKTTRFFFFYYLFYILLLLLLLIVLISVSDILSLFIKISIHRLTFFFLSAF